MNQHYGNLKDTLHDLDLTENDMRTEEGKRVMLKYYNDSISRIEELRYTRFSQEELDSDMDSLMNERDCYLNLL